MRKYLTAQNGATVAAVLAVFALLVPNLRSGFYFFGHGFIEPAWLEEILPVAILATVIVTLLCEATMGVAAANKKCSIRMRVLLGCMSVFMLLTMAWSSSIFALSKLTGDSVETLIGKWGLLATLLCIMLGLSSGVTGVFLSLGADAFNSAAASLSYPEAIVPISNDERILNLIKTSEKKLDFKDIKHALNGEISDKGIMSALSQQVSRGNLIEDYGLYGVAK